MKEGNDQTTNPEQTQNENVRNKPLNQTMEESNKQTTHTEQTQNEQIRNKPLILTMKEGNDQTTNIEQTQNEKVRNEAMNQTMEESNDHTTNIDQTQNEKVRNEPLNQTMEESNDHTTNIEQTQNEKVRNEPLNQTMEERNDHTTNIEQTQNEKKNRNEPLNQTMEEINDQTTNIEQTQDEQIEDNPLIIYRRTEEKCDQATNIEQAQVEYDPLNQAQKEKLGSFFRRINSLVLRFMILEIEESNGHLTNILQTQDEQIRNNPLHQTMEQSNDQTTNIEQTQDEQIRNKPLNQTMKEVNDQTTNIEQTQDEQIRNNPLHQTIVEGNGQTRNIEQTQDEQIRNKPLNQTMKEGNDQTTNIEQTQDEQIRNKPLNQTMEEGNDQTTNIEQTQDEQVEDEPLIIYRRIKEKYDQTTNTGQTQDEQVTTKLLDQRMEENNYQRTIKEQNQDQKSKNDQFNQAQKENIVSRFQHFILNALSIDQTDNEQIINNPLNEEQKKKLESFFQHIILNAPLDYTSQEIEDIQYAIHEMLERIMTRVNNRGVLNITRIVPTGSMSEKTATWKYDKDEKEPYLEFDNLAVLKASVRQYEDYSAYSRCPGCINISNPPVELTPLAQHELDLMRKRWKNSKTDCINKDMINDIFLYEINNCLTSSCDCLTVHTEEMSYSFHQSSLNTKYGCDKCAVDMPTGILSVNTDKAVVFGEWPGYGPNKCSLILKWTSKTNSLLAPDKLLQQKQPIISMPIYIDFLPAMESLKPTSPGTGYTHDNFIVPKNCNVCEYDDDDDDYRWRKSWCMAEIQAFKTGMSDKHRQCYQITKYLAKDSLGTHVNKYFIKNVVLQHSTTCSDTSDNYVDCVIKVYQDILNAFKRRKFLSYHSNINILSRTDHREWKIYEAYYHAFLTHLYSVPETAIFDRFVTGLWFRCESAAHWAWESQFGQRIPLIPICVT